MDIKKKQTNKKKNQEIFLEVYFKTLGNISNACKDIKISRAVYYQWMNCDEEFKERFDEITETFDDDIETTIRAMATGGDRDLLKFWASRKMKNRGFTEKTEQSIEHKGNIDLSLIDLCQQYNDSTDNTDSNK